MQTSNTKFNRDPSHNSEKKPVGSQTDRHGLPIMSLYPSFCGKNT